jgi:hypothetical protein
MYVVYQKEYIFRKHGRNMIESNLLKVEGANYETSVFHALPSSCNVHDNCRGVGTMASIIVRVSVRVRVSGGLGGLKNMRITERTQRFILVWADRCPTSSS